MALKTLKQHMSSGLSGLLRLVLVVVFASAVAGCSDSDSDVELDEVAVDVSPAKELRAAGGDEAMIGSVQQLYEGLADHDCAGLDGMRQLFMTDGPRMLGAENRRAWAQLAGIAELRMAGAGCPQAAGSASVSDVEPILFELRVRDAYWIGVSDENIRTQATEICAIAESSESVEEFFDGLVESFANESPQRIGELTGIAEYVDYCNPSGDRILILWRQSP
jgi:hypothetical protein